MNVIYSPRYNITLFGVERLHPFDSRKYGRAWAVLKDEFGSALSKHHVPVETPVSQEEFLLVHTPEYLAGLRSAATLAKALELPPLAPLPANIIRWRVLL